MKTPKLVSLFFMLLITSGLGAQTIVLHMPALAGESYDYIVFRGDNCDTLATGIIPGNGQVVLNIPASYNDFRGISWWVLSNNPQAALFLVLAGQSYSATCKTNMPNNLNTTFAGSTEMDYFTEMFHKQQVLFAQWQAYNPQDINTNPNPIPFPLGLSDKDSPYRQHEALMQELAKSPLYAARFLEIYETIFVLNKATHDLPLATKTNEYIFHQLNWRALYHSAFWDVFFNAWIKLNMETINNDSLFISQIGQLIKRLPTNDLYTNFVEKYTSTVHQTEKLFYVDNLVDQIGSSGRLQNYDGELYFYKGIFTGNKAPALKGFPDVTFGDKTLLVFYGAQCGHCSTTMDQLTRDYDQLAMAGIKVISVDTEPDHTIFMENAQKYPWHHKLRETNGFSGENILTYGIYRVPAIFLIDGNQKVIGRFVEADTKDIIQKFKQ